MRLFPPGRSAPWTPPVDLARGVEPLDPGEPVGVDPDPAVKILDDEPDLDPVPRQIDPGPEEGLVGDRRAGQEGVAVDMGDIEEDRAGGRSPAGHDFLEDRDIQVFGVGPDGKGVGHRLQVQHLRRIDARQGSTAAGIPRRGCW